MCILFWIFILAANYWNVVHWVLFLFHVKHQGNFSFWLSILQEWFSSRRECPAGCGHNCQYRQIDSMQHTTWSAKCTHSRELQTQPFSTSHWVLLSTTNLLLCSPLHSWTHAKHRFLSLCYRLPGRSWNRLEMKDPYMFYRPARGSFESCMLESETKSDACTTFYLCW